MVKSNIVEQDPPIPCESSSWTDIRVEQLEAVVAERSGEIARLLGGVDDSNIYVAVLRAKIYELTEENISLRVQATKHNIENTALKNTATT